ncbi:AsmA family protein [Roseivirga misakiensis]|uniref:AsmA domain-containing protein n=1 Tax=Roseivirga misakiensis TaxID=1563681 RepID=A0A1E5T2F4_9BACT|nr:AsmA-like C-terminal region-containing protein [Roseivirga misakiensis]OEK05568.1 hypothetical protein BFP71_13060 [Roseivirga misakiensis]
MAETTKIRKWMRRLGLVFSLLILLFTIIIGITYNQQDRLIQKALTQLNHDFKGEFKIEGSHISPFANFPYVSIDLENVAVYETKADSSEALVQIQDVYVGFDLLSIIRGIYEIHKIKLSDGFVKFIQHTDGTFNITNALSGEIEEESETTDGPALHLSLDAIELSNIDVLKINESTNLLAEVFIEEIKSSVSTSDEHIKARFDSRLLFNLVLDGDTSFLHDKHLQLSTGVDYDLTTGILDITPSELLIEKAEFLMDGMINVNDEMNLDLKFSGQKPNFDLFLAFVPEEYSPLLRRYNNGGSVFFDATIKGPSANGKIPHVEIDFGCEEAFIENVEVSKSVDELFFKGHFTTGELNTPESMSLEISDFTARPETGTFRGGVSIKNFDSPDIEMNLNSEFNLEFLADFLNIQNLSDLSGTVALDMNFHDIVDLDDPSKAIERLNESYFTELKVENLNFTSPDLNLPFRDINIHAAIDGHKAEIDQFNLKAGNSDISLSASISDLPAILHHTNLPVNVNLNLNAGLIDIQELTRTEGDSLGIDEQIKDLSMKFQFNSSARAFTESPHLPLGEFFISELNAQLTNYPHKLHDFDVDVIIDSTDFKVIDFTGMLDQSDFHFNGELENYHLWFEKDPNGISSVDFDFNSSQIQLEDLFSYGGENYVPEDYQHETLADLKMHGISSITFKNKLQSVQLDIDKIEAKANEHDMRLENFNGSVFVDSTLLEVKKLGGQLGNTQLEVDLTYHLDDTETTPHQFTLRSPRLDFDQLFAYVPPSENSDTSAIDHEAGFNLFDLPFANIEFNLDVDHINYHKYLLDSFKLEGRMQKDHFIYLDTLSLQAAGGQMDLNGYFNGSNPDKIYFSPNMKLKNVDLDKLLFKFDNFGQDQLVSNNLHGKLSGSLSGQIHMHPDLIPATDVSDLEIDVEVLNGSLVNFTPFQALSSFFTDKNLNLVRFDTLKNTLSLKNGDLIIPKMNINTSLGFFEISGRQGLDLNMDYNMRIPLRVVTRAGFQKLFGRKNRDNSDQIDEIQYRNDKKRTRFISVNISGTAEDYSVSLGKPKN